VSGGKSLLRHWNYKQEPDQKWKAWETAVPNGDTFEPVENFYGLSPEDWRFGLYDTALTQHKWDKVVLQLYRSNLHDDLEALGNFIDLILTNKATERIVLYSTWPRRPARKGPDGKRSKEVDNLDYASEWLGDYAATPEETGWTAGWKYASRDYVETIVRMLSERYPNLPTPLRVIPGGEVLYELDKAIKANALPGLDALIKRSPPHVPGLDSDTTKADGVNILYADGIHLNPMPHNAPTLGVYAVAMTMFSVLAEQSPVGLPGAVYDLDETEDAELIKAVQELVWRVVSRHPSTGLKGR
jgi:hypothetical protein